MSGETEPTPDIGPDAREAEAVDRLMARAWTPDPADTPEAHDERRMLVLLRELDRYPVEASDASLTDATLARIAQHERQQQARMRAERAPLGRHRWADLGGLVAATLLLAGLLWPFLVQVRARSIQSACANNMRSVSSALHGYAMDHRDHLPMTAGLASLMAPRPASHDWHTYSHGANLHAMVGAGYGTERQLCCPGCASDHHRQMAYRMPSVDRGFRLQLVGQGALVSDANPFIEIRIRRRPPGAARASWNHDQSGQNVLFGDGRILWAPEPEVGPDNIFLPSAVQEPDLLPRLVQPTAGPDAFLAQ